MLGIIVRWWPGRAGARIVVIASDMAARACARPGREARRWPPGACLRLLLVRTRRGSPPTLSTIHLGATTSLKQFWARLVSLPQTPLFRRPAARAKLLLQNSTLGYPRPREQRWPPSSERAEGSLETRRIGWLREHAAHGVPCRGIEGPAAHDGRHERKKYLLPPFTRPERTTTAPPILVGRPLARSRCSRQQSE